MECYNCNAVLGQEDFCPNCGTNVRVYKKIIMASNAYYNDALEKVSVRNLSGAAESLRLSLRFNKMNIDARNLLGLVYFEMGEVVEALTEWVLSKHYQPKENIASRYLNEIQDNAARLDTINQTIKKYNQALLYCKQDSKDLAIIQLKKVLSLNPKLVSGYQLLALIHIQEQKYDQAKKVLQSAAKIDTNNTVTLRYLQEVNEHLKESSSAKKPKNEEQVSYRSGNETIIQPKHRKENAALATIINMVIGIVIGAAITGFLVVPGVRRQVQNAAKEELVEANNTVSAKNQTISTLEKQIEELNVQVADAKEGEESVQSRVSSYEQLLQAYAAYVAKDITAAGAALEAINQEYLSEESKALYGTIYAEVNAEYINALYREGYQAYQSQKFEESIESLKKVVEIDEQHEQGYALFYLAQAYRKIDDSENAKIYYQKVAELYPGTKRASTAQNYLAAGN